jgi:hypothetical protein
MHLLAECLQYYCRKIQKIFAFLISLYYLKYYDRPDHLICIVEYRRKIIIIYNILTVVEVVAHVYVLCWNKQLWFWCQSSVMLSFQAMETALTGSWTWDTLPEFWPSCVLFLNSRNKHAKIGVYGFVCSWAVSEHTDKRTDSFNFVHEITNCISKFTIMIPLFNSTAH